MIKSDQKKISEKDYPKIVKEDNEGIVVNPAYDFLFEGENKEYDEEYEDYI